MAPGSGLMLGTGIPRLINSGRPPNYCTLYNCTLTDNSANLGGGAIWCTLYNSTLSGNSASGGYGGGANASTLNNCIVYYNPN